MNAGDSAPPTVEPWSAKIRRAIHMFGALILLARIADLRETTKFLAESVERLESIFDSDYFTSCAARTWGGLQGDLARMILLHEEALSIAQAEDGNEIDIGRGKKRRISLSIRLLERARDALDRSNAQGTCFDVRALGRLLEAAGNLSVAATRLESEAMSDAGDGSYAVAAADFIALRTENQNLLTALRDASGFVALAPAAFRLSTTGASRR